MHIENMSIRAHRILTMEYAPEPTFNCSDETELMDFLLDHPDTSDRRDPHSGVIEVGVDGLQAALDSTALKLEAGVRERLQGDLASSKFGGDEYIMYDCF
jgi:hypothetical protein